MVKASLKQRGLAMALSSAGFEERGFIGRLEGLAEIVKIGEKQ
jgi:hypothetical protein